jgi:hypothetical protein
MGLVFLYTNHDNCTKKAEMPLDDVDGDDDDNLNCCSYNNEAPNARDGHIGIGPIGR